MFAEYIGGADIFGCKMEIKMKIDYLRKAKWIFANTAKRQIVDSYFCYEKNFFSAASDAFLYISAHSDYAVFINNVFLDCGQFQDYEGYPAVDCLDLSCKLKIGENELKILHYVQGTDFSTSSKGIPGVIFAVVSGDDILCLSDESCLVYQDVRFEGNAEIITPQLGYNFDYNAMIPVQGKRPAVILKGKSNNFIERPVKKLLISALKSGVNIKFGYYKSPAADLPKAKKIACSKLYENIDGVEIKEGNKFIWDITNDKLFDGFFAIFDLGGENVGLLEFSVNVPSGTEILIGYGEHLEDGAVRCAIGNRNFAFKYISKEGENSFFYPFRRLGLRFLQVHIKSNSGILNRIGIHPVSYPLKQNYPELKKPLHNQISKVAIKTLSLCMHEHFEDCPWREQSLYALDGRIQMLCSYYAFKDYDFAKASLTLLAHGFRPNDNLLELCAPGKVSVNIPAFTAEYIRAVWEYLVYSGDSFFVSGLLPMLKIIVEGMYNRITDFGLVPLYKENKYWNFYEWNAGLDGNRFSENRACTESQYIYESPLNIFISDALVCLSKICEHLNDEEYRKYSLYARKLNKRIHQVFWNEKSGCYLTCSTDENPLHALVQGLMLYIGAVPRKNIRSVCAAITEDKLIPATLSMNIYVFEGLLRNGGHKRYVLGRIEQLWGTMLNRGADTFWETSDGAKAFDKAGSLCHGWSAVPLYIFRKYYYDDSGNKL